MIRKSAKGRMIDLDQVINNSETVAVGGGVRMNARGDILDEAGRVSISREDQPVPESYTETVKPITRETLDSIEFKTANQFAKDRAAQSKKTTRKSTGDDSE